MKYPNEQTVSRSINADGGSAKPKAASLVVLTGAMVGKMFRLADEQTLIGRAGGAEVWLDDDSVSRQHARLVRQGDEVELVDLGSRNGTFVNGSKVSRTALRDGDKIQIGSTTILKFSVQDALDEEMHQSLYESATTDALTGLYNRKLFLEVLEKEFAYTLRHHSPVTLLLVDVDHFKEINDNHGHAAGDFVLERLAKALSAAARVEDLVARYGGEEFVLLLRECNDDGAKILAERLRNKVDRLELTFNGQTVPLTVSIGAATLVDARYGSVEELIKAADDCLYAAKEQGRNRTVTAAEVPLASPQRGTPSK